VSISDSAVATMATPPKTHYNAIFMDTAGGDVAPAGGDWRAGGVGQVGKGSSRSRRQGRKCSNNSRRGPTPTFAGCGRDFLGVGRRIMH